MKIYNSNSQACVSSLIFMRLSLRLKVIIFLLFISNIPATIILAQPIEFRNANINQWDILDWRGDAKIFPTTDPTCPPGYGPEVLHVEGGVVLGLVKGKKMSEGTFVALYRENEPRDFDADGIIMVKSDYEQDISRAHNIKEKRPHVWLEQDNDCGLQIRLFDTEGKEENLAELCGSGVVTDSWNRTNWIWQKINIEANIIRAKTWPAHQEEPKDWVLQAVYKSVGERFGIKINSGNINLAYFAADERNITIKPPPYFLYTPIMRITQSGQIAFTLFTNSSKEKYQQVQISILNNGKSLAHSNSNLKIPPGSNELSLILATDRGNMGKTDIDVILPKEPAEGPLQLVLSDENGNILADRTVMVLPVKRMRERFAKRRQTIKQLDVALTKGKKDSQAYKEIKVIHDAATSHLDHAIDLFDEGDMDGSDMAFRFVDEALAELEGYKKTFLTELNPESKIPIPSWDATDKRGISNSPDQHVIDAYSTEHLLSFRIPEISAQSLVMGRTYDLTIPWHVQGGIPDKDYSFIVRMVSPLGNRIVAKSTTGPEIPTSKWVPGKIYTQHVKLSVSPEDPTMGKGQPAQPAILDEYHTLLITVIDPETGARLILGNSPGPQPERVGQSFSAGEYFISSTPLEIGHISTGDGEAGVTRYESIDISNHGSTVREAGLLFSVCTASNKIVHQDYKPISINAGGTTSVRFDWKSLWAGKLESEIKIIEKNVTLTEAKRKIIISLPAGSNTSVSKMNTVIKQEGNYYTPIRVEGDFDHAEVFVYSGRHLAGKAKGSKSVLVNAEPWFGYYDVEVHTGEYIYSKRLIATVVETRDMDILVNGEPFLIKGVNVHGLDGRSPEKTASMMRIMREIGFNAWRGDYPPLWQMELAYELNSFYTVLGPFSCTSTEEIFARQAGPPLTTARELSRLLVERYKNSAGVLLWNSCNEIQGEKEDFLRSLKPVFKTFDPYKRPVHYSNLFGQDLHIGQDIMGINYYFGAGQTAMDKQPIIQRSIDIARKNNLPVMYNEFNSFVGAIHTTGVEAMYDMYEWGLEQGMCGGFQYMKGNSTSHPGIFDDGFNTHKIYNEAIIDVLADAEITIRRERSEERGVTLRVRNKRRFTLRQIRISLTVSDLNLASIKLPDMAPESIKDVTIQLAEELVGPAISIKGHIEFITHHGFRNKVPFWLVETQ